MSNLANIQRRAATDNETKRTDSVWLMVTSSTLVLKWGVHGGSTMGRHGSPIVGDGRTKSMLGGGTWHYIYQRSSSTFDLIWRRSNPHFVPVYSTVRPANTETPYVRK